jgi:SAM-dependent methyltransferase
MTVAAPRPASPSPIRPALLDLLACPEDGAALSGWDGSTDDGTLDCPACRRRFPVQDGLPRLLPDALREARDAEYSEKQREMAARDAQVAQYDANLPLRLFSIPEIPITLRYLALEPDHLMLEGGCGTGRMTPEFARRVRGLVCADISVESLKAARAKLPPELGDRALFVQADLSHLPLATGVFDRVGSFQVLEHLPTPDARARAVAELVRVAKRRTEGGRIALSAYRWGAPVPLVARKSGHHAGGIPFFRATWAELSEMLAPHLTVGGRTGALLYHFLVWGRKRMD